jgi:hypothetical protein
MKRNISQIHQALAWLFLAGLLVQFYLAGAPMFGVTSFQPHRMLGTALEVLAILLAVLSLIGNVGRRLRGLSILLLCLALVQGMLPSVRGTVSWLAALHSVNALALVGISIRIGRQHRVEALEPQQTSVLS